MHDRFTPGAVVLLMNDVWTYPGRIASTYDAVRVIELLQENGVQEHGRIVREEAFAPRSIFSHGKDILRHNEVWFVAPEQDRQAALFAALDAFFPQGSKPLPRPRLNDWHPNAHLVCNAIARLPQLVDLQIEDFGLLVESRDEGDVGDEMVSQEDYALICALGDRLHEEIPGLQFECQSVNEWAMMTCNFADMDTINRPAPGRPSVKP